MIEIELQGLSKAYGRGPSRVWAVAEVDLRIEAGELFFLLGPSGCGKTTLLRMIAGLVSPTSGRVRLGGRDVTDLPVEKRNTAMVFQNYALWPHMTVSQNVEFGPRMRGVSPSDRRQRGVENLRRVEMEAYAGRRPNQLSGGQQQRVALARALAAEPECLLLDEPLSNLDARLRSQMRAELRRLVKAGGTTGVYVTHDQKEALSMADRIAVMNEGRIVQVGAPGELYHRPATHFVADFLGEANFLPGRVAEGAPLRVETACGVLTSADDTGSFAPGEAVTCCVRPERVRIAPAGAEEPVLSKVRSTASKGPPSLPATIENVTFLGETRQYVCRLSDETRWKVTSLAEGDPATAGGAAVALHVPPEAVAVLPGELPREG